MKKFLMALSLIPVLSLPSQSLAEETKSLDLPGTITGNVSFLSEYSFRGITQSAEEPAAQGALTWTNSYDSGLGSYLGIWGSNVDFNDSDEASIEIDYSAGLTYSVDKWSFDLGALYYTYPGAASRLNYDYLEGQVIVGYNFDVASVAASFNYSPENFGDSGDAQYYKLSGKVPLSHGFTLDGRLARQEVEDNTAFAYPDYNEWGAGISYNIEGIDLKAEYVDTDMSTTECADGCDARGIFSVSKSF